MVLAVSVASVWFVVVSVVAGAVGVRLLFVSAFDSLSKNDCNNCGLSITSNKQRFWSIIHHQES